MLSRADWKRRVLGGADTVPAVRTGQKSEKTQQANAGTPVHRQELAGKGVRRNSDRAFI